MRVPVLGVGMKTLLTYVALTMAGIFGLSFAIQNGYIPQSL